MKKTLGLMLALAMVLFLMAAPVAIAETEYATQSLVVYWDPITTDATGAAIPGTTEIAYNVFVREKTTLVEHQVGGSTQNTTFTVVETARGEWYIGVQCFFNDAANNQEYGPISWSSEPGNILGDTFYMRTYFVPGAVVGIRTTQ